MSRPYFSEVAYFPKGAAFGVDADLPARPSVDKTLAYFPKGAAFGADADLPARPSIDKTPDDGRTEPSSAAVERRGLIKRK